MPAGAWTGSRETDQLADADARYDPIGAADDEIAAHLAALDPHGDRLFTTAAPVPASIAGLKMWLDASHILSSDGTPVAVWDDRSGFGNSLGQGIPGKRPLYRAAGLGGQPALIFDGQNDILACDYPISTVVDNFTMVLVCRNDHAIGGSNSPLIVGSGGDGWGISVAGDTNYYGALYGAVAWNNTTTPEDGVASILILERAAGVATLYRNGIALAPTWSGAPATPAGFTRLGNFNDSAGAAYFNGPIAQALVYEAALTTQNRLDLNRHFGTRYGIVVP